MVSKLGITVGFQRIRINRHSGKYPFFAKNIPELKLVMQEMASIFAGSLLSEKQWLPAFFIKGKFAFLIKMLSRATRQIIKPIKLTVTFELANKNVIDFFGISPQKDSYNSITFSTSDLQKPFKSKNLSLLDYLEPELKKRLAELDVDDSYAKRVRSVLVELLPRGFAGVDDVAKKLGISKRTLQRNLKAEATNFQQQLNETREMLAKNYLLNTNLSTDEIAFLLAYQEVNFFQWHLIYGLGKPFINFDRIVFPDK